MRFYRCEFYRVGFVTGWRTFSWHHRLDCSKKKVEVAISNDKEVPSSHPQPFYRPLRKTGCQSTGGTTCTCIPLYILKGCFHIYFKNIHFQMLRYFKLIYHLLLLKSFVSKNSIFFLYLLFFVYFKTFDFIYKTIFPQYFRRRVITHRV